jgi:NADH:ubiquinone oxidoreductase subunit E
MASIDLVVCMGSACFSRGNGGNLERVRAYLQEHDLEKAVNLTGTLCQDRCRQGPNMTLQGECFCGLDPSALLAVLDERLGRTAGDPP